MDETYESIFSSIDPEDQALVRHGLAWICFQDWLCNGHHGVTPSNLIDSFYRTQGCNLYLESHSRFTRDDLQDMCGCLLTFRKRSWDDGGYEEDFEYVFLAHYTVREYLSSERILGSTAAAYALRSSLDNQVFLGVIFEAAIESKVRTTDERELLELAGTPFADFESHSISGCCQSIYHHEDDICKSDHLTTLAFAFVQSLLGVIERLFVWERSWGIQCDRLVNNQLDAACLLYLVWGPRHKLAEKFCHLLQDRSALQRVLSTTITAWVDDLAQDTKCPAGKGSYHDEFPACEVAGTPLEITAQLGPVDTFEFFLQRTCDAGAATKALVLSVGSHQHRGERDGKCRLQVALQAGADPNTTGFWATPLQIAVASRDFPGVESLIEAGADVNGLGDDGAEMWEANTLMGRFNCLHDLSPLYICKLPRCICFQTESFEDESFDDRRKIEELLLGAGAKDTARNGPYLDYEYRIDWNFQGRRPWACWDKGELIAEDPFCEDWYCGMDIDSKTGSTDVATSDGDSGLGWR